MEICHLGIVSSFTSIKKCVQTNHFNLNSLVEDLAKMLLGSRVLGVRDEDDDCAASHLKTRARERERARARVSCARIYNMNSECGLEFWRACACWWAGERVGGSVFERACGCLCTRRICERFRYVKYAR